MSLPTRPNIKVGDIIEVEVINVNKWQAIVKIEGWLCDIPIPKSELAVPEPEFAYDIVHIGDKISVYVINVNKGYLSKIQAERIKPWRKLEKYCQEHKTVRAEVKYVIKEGLVAYVDGLRGFIPAEQVALSYIHDLSGYVGQTLEVCVIEIDVNRQRMVLSRRRILEEEKRKKEALRQQELKRQEEESVIFVWRRSGILLH